VSSPGPSFTRLAGRGAYGIRALSDLGVGDSIGLSRDRSGLSRRFILPPLKPRHARGSLSTHRQKKAPACLKGRGLRLTE
jgi:hypothetical protein